MLAKVNNQGQIVVILILIIVIGVALALTLIQRSASSLLSSARVEQSTRAFAAAEAGVEKALQDYNDPNIAITFTIDPSELDNQASAQVEVTKDLPTDREGLHYGTINRAQFAQIWLADPGPANSPPTPYYLKNTLYVYFGNVSQDMVTRPNLKNGKDDPPAIEVNVVTLSGGQYKSNRFYFRSPNSLPGAQGFVDASCNENGISLPPSQYNRTFDYVGQKFYCRAEVSGYLSSGDVPILARVRLFGSASEQSLAFAPFTNNCSLPYKECSFPPQMKIVISKGYSGESQRTIKALRVEKVVPHLLDFVLFAQADLEK